MGNHINSWDYKKIKKFSEITFQILLNLSVKVQYQTPCKVLHLI